MEIFMNANGWMGVGLGLLMFGMGYWKGVSNTVNRVIPATVEATVDQMIADGYIKFRKVLNDEGKWEKEILKHDEEV